MICKHYADLHGRCMDCGLSWGDRAALSEWLALKRPLNWEDMGSSSRDLWEERMTRSWLKGFR